MKTLRALGRPLARLLKIAVVVNALAVPIGLYDYWSYRRLPPETDPAEAMLPSDLAAALIGLVQLGLSLAVAVVFLMWVFRANKNLRVLSDRPLRFTPGWSVGVFFIPIVNLYRPYQVVKEIWLRSHRDPSARHGLVGWWWCFWIISAMLGKVALRMMLRADDLSGYLASTAVYVASDGIDVVLGVVALVMVTRIAAAYARNYVECPPVPGAAPAARP